MNTTILSYPGFQTLPKGIKQMLLVSEAHFFDQPASHHQERLAAAQDMGTRRGFRVFLTSLLFAAGAAVGCATLMAQDGVAPGVSKSVF
jgi:hypothetical protein